MQVRHVTGAAEFRRQFSLTNLNRGRFGTCKTDEPGGQADCREKEKEKQHSSLASGQPATQGGQPTLASIDLFRSQESHQFTTTRKIVIGIYFLMSNVLMSNRHLHQSDEFHAHLFAPFT